MKFHGTTIVAIKKDGCTAIAGDGQVTLGERTMIKQSARKVRRLYQDQVVVGFAGSVADAFTLLEKFEGKLNEHRGNLLRAAVQLTKEWRMDKYLRNLEAMLIAADQDKLLLLSGTGEVIEPDDGVLAVGSGGAFALAAARALLRHTNLPASQMAAEAVKIASEICVYTNDNIVVETVGGEEKSQNEA